MPHRDQRIVHSYYTNKQPGTVGDDAELSPWDSFQFLEKRDIFFGIKFYF